MVAERLIRTGDRREKCRLEHGLEPLHPDPRVSEHTLKVRIEGAEVEERFVDVEYEDAFHWLRRRGWDSNPRSFRSQTFQVCALSRTRRPLHFKSVIRLLRATDRTPRRGDRRGPPRDGEPAEASEAGGTPARGEGFGGRRVASLVGRGEGGIRSREARGYRCSSAAP